jgi:hypothetical protein
LLEGIENSQNPVAPPAQTFGPSRGQAEAAPNLLNRALGLLSEQAESGSPYAAGALQDVESLAPAVRAGLISQNTVQGVVQSAAMGDIAFQRNVRNAERDVAALNQAWRSNQIDEQQYASGLQSAVSEYGQNTLTHVQSYREAAGIESDFQQAKQASIRQYAKQIGAPEEFVSWDDRENAPVLNNRVIQGRSAAAQLRFAEARAEDAANNPLRDKANLALKYLEVPKELDAIAKATMKPFEVRQYNKDRAAAIEQRGKLLEVVLGGSISDIAAGRTGGGPLSFPDENSVLAAIDAGRVEIGDTVVVGGEEYTVGE